MPQYFDNVEALEHKDITVEFTLQGEKCSLKSDRGVFSKDSLDDGTRYLLETILQADLGTSLLDVGCGIGPIGLILAKADPKRYVTLVRREPSRPRLSERKCSISGRFLASRDHHQRRLHHHLPSL